MPLLDVPDNDRDLHVNVIAKWAQDHGKIFNHWRYLGQVQRSGYDISQNLQTSLTGSALTLEHAKYLVRRDGREWHEVHLLVGADNGVIYYATLAPIESGGATISPPPADKSA